MLFWSLKVFFISIIIIYLCHSLIDNFKNILTVPKTKDLIHSSSNKYSQILSIIQSDPHTLYMNSLQNNDNINNININNINTNLLEDNIEYHYPQDNSIVPIFNQTNSNLAYDDLNNSHDLKTIELNKIRNELADCLINALKK